MKKWQHILVASLAVCLCGSALSFAFSPFDLSTLALICPAGLMLLSRQASARQAFYLGLLFGLSFFASGVYWVFISIHDYGNVDSITALGISAGFILVLALFPALVNYLSNRYAPHHIQVRILCLFPGLWLISEYFRGLLFTGFPWLFLGYSQMGTPLQAYAPIFSVYGVSLAVLFSNSLLSLVYLNLKIRRYFLGFLSLFFLLCLWIGGMILSYVSWTQAIGHSTPVALVQGNIPQSLKWSPESLSLSIDRYINLSTPLWQPGKLIIWPEAAIPLPYQDAVTLMMNLDETAKKHQSHLLLGIPVRVRGEDQQSYYYNALLSLGADKQSYFKRRLVPFGEYTPKINLVFTPYSVKSFLQFINLPLPNSIPGNNIQEPMTINGLKIAASICYEIAYPELIRIRDQQIGLLLTVTNDAWFGVSSAQAQHLQMARMRALEVGRPLLFVSNDGITAIIEANGSIQAAAPAHQVFVLEGSVQPTHGMTPWMNYGPTPILLIALCLILISRHQERRFSQRLSSNKTVSGSR